MQSQTTSNESIADKKVFIKMATSAWDSYNARVNKLLNTLSDVQLMAETAPGRNTGIYLIGHLIAVSDGLFPILGFGERLYPALDKIFLEAPDKSGAEMPSISELKEYWKNVNTKLDEHISKMPADDWFTRHNNVSEADFAKEPHRNKLNIIINRTGHTSYHLGQLIYLSNQKD
ncbi:MAG: DinB family protein [Chitinophagaceae bacterium]